MADTTTTIKLRAVDDGAISTIGKIDNAFTGLTIGTTALSVVFKGLEKATDSSFSRMVLGTANAEKATAAIAKLTDVNSKALKTFSALGDITFLAGQALTFVKGVQDATAVYARIPQTLDLLRSSGVSTRSIEDFYTLTDAVKGSEASLEAFAVSAVEQLGRFEQAAARVGTILRSSTNFDATGNALRASQQEQLQNAFQVQEIVNTQINNTVSSTEALAGQYEVLSSGFTKTAESQQVLASGLKLIGIAQAGGAAASPTDTLQLLVKTLNAYELGASEAAKVSAILNATVDSGITTIQEISLNFGQTAKTAKAANVGLVDVASATATLTAQGINTANALTGLQSVFGAIISKTPESEKALAKLSLNGQKIRFDLAEVQAKGFTQALLDLNKAAGGNAQILQEIFSEEITFRTVLALLAQDGQKLAATTSSIGGVTASSLDEVFKIATSDRVNRFQQIANRFQELIIKVAASVAPVFEPGLAVLEKIASFFSGLPEPVKGAIGSFIAFQITSRATVGAVGILFQTLLNLAGTYLQVRLVSLALSGQLGKELAVVRDLVTQRKGLLAVALQLFGVDQRYRLATEATTAALEKQNIVTKAIAAGRAKVGEIFNQNVAGFTGQPIENAKNAGKQLVDKGRQALGSAVASAKNVGLGIAEATGIVATPQILGPDGKPLGSSGLERVKQEAQKAGEAIASGFGAVKQKAQAALPKVEILGADGKPLNTEAIKQQAQNAANAVTSGIGEAKQKAEALQKQITPKQFDLVVADNTSFLAGNKGFQDATSIVEKAASRELEAQKQLEVATKKLGDAREQASKKGFAAEEARIKALDAINNTTTTAEQKQKLLTKAVNAQTTAQEASAKVTELQNQVYARQADLQQARGERIDAQLALDAKQEELATKYAAAAEKQVLARRFNAQAASLEEKALTAKAKADELEAIASLKPGDIDAQTKAKQARAAATALEEKATKLKARAETEAAAATQLATAADKAAILAEQGLAQTRIFGRNVVFSTQGPLGAINKLLTTEITLKTVAAGATRSLAIAQGTATGAAKILGIALSALIAGVGALGKAAIGVGAQGITALIGTLGPLAPLLVVGGLAIAAFRDDLFGLRKAANEAANGLGEVIKKDADLKNQFGKERRLIEFKSELKDGTSPQQIETRLEQLRLSGDLTTGQFNQLRETLVRVGEQGQVTAKGLEEFKSQLEAIRQGASGKPDKGVGDQIGDFFKSIPVAIGTAFDGFLNTGAFVLANPLNQLQGRGFINPLEGISDIAQNREADRLIQNFSQLSIATEVAGDASLATAEKLAKYRQGLGLTAETNEKLRKGIQLTQEDLEREGQLFNEQKTRNENLISGLEKNITDQKKILEQVKDPELKKQLEEQINLLEQERQTLEKRNEALKVGREEFVKYYTETLPNLKRAITESSNPQQALINATTNFNQQFKLDAQGKATPFLKDVTTLRNEAQQYVTQVLEAYQSGLFEQNLNSRPGVAEAQVAQRLREARDNKITLPDGTQGFRLSLSDRIAATGQIVEFEQQASKARGEAIKLEVEQVKLAQQQRVLGEEEAQKRIAQLNLKALRETLSQKQIEVKEYAQFPVRKAQLEREAAAIRIAIEQAVAAEDLRQLSLRRERRQNEFNLEIEQVKTLQAERAISGQQAEQQIANIQIRQTNDRLNTLVEDYNKSGKTSIELEQKIAQTRLQLRQQEAAEVERTLNLEQERQKRILANTTQLQTLVLQASSARLENRGKDLEDSQKLFNSATGLQLVQADAVEAQLNNQLKFTGDVQKRAVIEKEIAENKLRSLALTQEQERVSLNVQTQINKLQLEREGIQLRIQQIENKRQIAELNLELVKAQRDKRTPEEIQAIELQLKAATQQTDLLTQQEQRLERSKIQQQQIAENSQKELEIKQRLAITNAEIEVRLARQREIQAGIEKIARNIELAAQTSQLAGQIQINQSEALVKAYDQQKNLLQASQNLIKGRVDFVTGELQLASQLSTNERQKQRIAQTIAAIKLNSLEKQLALEEKVLNLNLAQQAAQLEQEKIRNRVSQSQNAADVAKAQADLAKTKADPTATAEAIRAAELNLQAKIEEGTSLQFAGTLLNQQGDIQKTLGNIERQNLKERGQLQRDQAKVDFIQTLNEGEQRKFSRQLLKDALQRGLGVSEDAIAPASQAFIKQTKNTLFGQDYTLEPLQQYYAGLINSRINPAEPSLQIQFPDFEEFRKNQLARLAEFGYQLPLPSKLSSQDLNTIGQVGLMDAVSKLTELVNQKLSNPNSVNLEVPITNNFETTDATTRQASDTVTQQIRQQLYDLAKELGR